MHGKLSTIRKNMQVQMVPGKRPIMKKNAIVKYAVDKTQLRVHSKCKAPKCNVYLHLTKEKNCFEQWHTTFQH